MFHQFLQLVIVIYTVSSPIGFLWFHRFIMKEVWDNDMADRVTVRLFVISNICAQFLAYMLEECSKCGG